MNKSDGAAWRMQKEIRPKGLGDVYKDWSCHESITRIKKESK